MAALPHGNAMTRKINGGTIGLADRKALLTAFDGFRRQVDASAEVAAADSFQQAAFNILTSSKLMEALDISKEPARVRERYGQGDPKNYGDGVGRDS